jgi:hypothetical protein
MTKSPDTTVSTIEWLPEERDAFRELAKSFGYTIGRGREKDWGSIRQLILAIVHGDVKVCNGNQT